LVKAYLDHDFKIAKFEKYIIKSETSRILKNLIMLKCSYILYVHNNEETILKVIDSLAKINGNFRREFIIIDDGSTDHSLQVIKNHIKALPRATIITQEHSGSAISINKALSLVKADYVHFVSAEFETGTNDTQDLINACIKYGAEVALYSEPSNKNRTEKEQIELIDQPLTAILTGNKFTNIRNIGEASSLVSYNLLIKIDGADESIYSVNPSLSLRCASSTKFICIIREHHKSLKQLAISETASSFDAYNQVLAIYNFMQEEPKACESHIKELIYYLFVSSQTYKRKASLFKNFIISKYFNRYSLDQVKELYKAELKRLF
jgi:glycosyltransferase involved in cell wall biosynthesis